MAWEDCRHDVYRLLARGQVKDKKSPWMPMRLHDDGYKPAAPSPHIPTRGVSGRTRQELETLGRTALPPPIGDIKVDLDWPGHSLIAVFRDGQGQGHLGKSRG